MATQEKNVTKIDIAERNNTSFLRNMNKQAKQSALVLTLAATTWLSACCGHSNNAAYSVWPGSGSGGGSGSSSQQQTVTLTENASPYNGGTVAPGSNTFNAGQNVNISEAPASGYAFSGWSCTGWGCYNGTDQSHTIVMNNNITETANFQLQQTSQPNETLAIDNNGCTSVSGAGTFAYGATAPFSAIVPASNNFNWSSTSNGGYSGTSNPAQVTMNGAITETANCTPITTPPPSAGTVYVLAEGSNPTVTVINSDQVIATLSLTGAPFSIVSDETSTVYVGLDQCGCGNQPQIQYITGTSPGQAVNTTVSPTSLFFNSDSNGTALYALSTIQLPPAQNIEVLNSPNSANPSIVYAAAPIPPTYMSFSPNGLMAYLTTNAVSSSDVSIMPTSTEILSGTTLSVPNAQFTTLSPDGTQVWVSSPASPANLTIFNTSTQEQIGSVTLPNVPSSYPAGPVVFNGNTAYVGNANYVAAIDTSSFQIVAQLPTNTLDEYVSISPNGKYILAPTVTSNENNVLQIGVEVISTADNTLVNTIPLGAVSGPYARNFQNIMFSQSGNEAYISGGDQTQSIDNFYILDTSNSDATQWSVKIAIQLPGEEIGMTQIPNNGSASQQIKLRK